MRLLAVALCLVTLIARPAIAMEEAERAAHIARIQREMTAAQERIIQEYLAEKQSAGNKADILLALGGLYEMGKFGDPDIVRAAEYYQLAAEEGSGEALCALGVIHNAGAKSASGEILRDAEKAIAFFEQAVEAGSVRAMVALGDIHANGENVPPDRKTALAYFLEAAKWGDPDALDRIAPVIEKAREWEEAKPERKGKAGFPTSREEIIDTELVNRNIDTTFNQQKLVSSVFVDISRRLMVAMQDVMKQ